MVSHMGADGSTQNMLRQVPWPFEEGRFPALLGAVVQRTVLSGAEPVRLVLHDDEGDWCVGDGINDPNEPDACVATHMSHVVEHDPAVAELATMPPGNKATRSTAGGPWVLCTFAYDE